jgi:hypothetical protein
MATWQPDPDLVDVVEEYLREHFEGGLVERAVMGRIVKFTVRRRARHYDLDVSKRFFDDIPHPTGIKAWLDHYQVANRMDKGRSTSNTVIQWSNAGPGFQEEEHRLEVGSRQCPMCRTQKNTVVVAQGDRTEDCECGGCGQRFVHRFRFPS